MRDLQQALRSAAQSQEAMRQIHFQLGGGFGEQLARQLSQVNRAIDTLRRDQLAITDAVRAMPLAQVMNLATRQSRQLQDAMDRLMEIHRSPNVVLAAQEALGKLNVAMSIIGRQGGSADAMAESRPAHHFANTRDPYLTSDLTVRSHHLR